MARPEKSRTNDMLLALRHPLRRQILQILAGGKPRSPRELADSLDESLSCVSYHVRVLADCGAAKMVCKRRIRGATEHFYRSSIESSWARTVLKNADDPKRGGSDEKKP